MKLPKSVKIGPFVYRIEAMDEKTSRRESKIGSCEHNLGLIRIAVGGCTQDQIADTVLHEIIHCVWITMNLKNEDAEERTVHGIATGMAMVIADNPLVWAWLRDNLAHGK